MGIVMMSEKMRAAVLLSGSGRTLQNFLTKMAAGQLPLEVVGVVSSKAGVGGLEIATAAGVPCVAFERSDFKDVASHNEAVNAWLAPLNPQLIILAGYLSYYIKPNAFTGPVVNIHPALLPKFGGKGYYGNRVHRAVLEAGETESGCTVHRVDDIYDNGQILGQKKVPVQAGDSVGSLAARVFAAECELYPEVLRALAQELLDRRS
ncbi:MAG: phosphoribosylglycinamide formyltransferase-1 [Candidatus Krumholzibacteriia bacterium]|jgi:phosphoribosylglycinamide formyltransferase-1